MNELLFKNVFIPFYYSVYKKSNRLEFYKNLIKRNSLSVDELYSIQWKRLKHLVNHCYNKIPHYQELFKKLDLHPNDIKNLTDYKKIPEFDEYSIIENPKSLINPELFEKELIIDHVSGSTGMPVKIYRTFEEQEYIYALRARSNAWCGWNYWNKSYWINAEHKYNDFVKSKFSLFINRKKIANTKNICPKTMYSWVKQIRTFKPDYLYGYSSLLEEFSTFLTDEHILLKGIKGVFSSVEPLMQRELISKAFKAPVFDEYGCSKMPSIAHECQYGNMHLNIDENLVEFESVNNDYKTKRIISTPLYLYGMPILRYNTGDTAIVIEENYKCSCGLPYPTVKLKTVKTNDNLLAGNGKLVSGEAITSYISTITTGIKQFQILQKDLFNITIKITSYTTSSEENELKIKKLFYELMETNLLKITFEYYDKMPPSLSGQFRPVISNISNNLNYRTNIRTNARLQSNK